MRKDPFTIGDYLHVYNRGNRKMPIVYDENDKWRFLKNLRYFNDGYTPEHIFRGLSLLRKSNFTKPFEWPKDWPVHNPLVKILAFCLMPNHFHLLLKEIKKGGVTKFMKKLGDGFTNYTNLKYEETGRLFQGSYKSRTVQEVKYIQYLDVYIQVLNPFEIYPGGIEKALKEFDKAFDFAMGYPFSSLGESFKARNLEIVDRDILKEMFSDLKTYKKFTYDALLVRNTREIIGRMSID